MRVGKRVLDPFWISVGLVVLFGTIGGVLYKIGTNQIQGITLDRLVQVELSRETLPYLFLLFLSVGLFFFSGYSLRDKIFAANYLFAPVIFLALIMLSLSRFVIGVPLSQRGLGQLTALLTALGVVATAVASWIVFRENFSLRAILGVALGVVAVILIGEA
jgi:multidrug transporter EmrE-like cation transporter